MRGILIFISACLIYFCPVISHASSINLIDGATFSLTGNFNGKQTSYLSDGYAETGTRWSKDSVWWIGGGSSIEISLNGAQKISSISIQADSNDEYQIDYWDADSSSWKTAFTAAVTKTAENNWLAGLDLRESGDVLDITTDKLRISAISGDNKYSVSEVQAFGAPTPIPPAILLLGSGLGSLIFIRRRFHRK